MRNQEPIVINLRKVNNGYSLDQDIYTQVVLKAQKNQQQEDKHESISQNSAQNDNQKSIKSNQNINDDVSEKPKELLNHKLIFKEELLERSKVFIPTSSSWFDINKIHKIEREALPEFFQMSNTKNPQSYKNLRNSIIEIFYKYPNRYLTAVNCLQLLGGDCCSIIRVHHFLEHWGLINFYFDIKNQDTQRCSVISGNKNAKLDMFQHYENYLNDKKYDRPLQFLHNLTQEITPNCDYCGQKCKTAWYIERKRKGEKENDQDDISYVLCPFCYSKEKFPSIYIKKDFKKQTLSELMKQQEQKKDKEDGQWSLDKSLQVLKKFKELDCNIKALSEELNLNIVEIIANFLKIPFKYFKNFNRLSTRNFEIIFKQNAKKKKIFDDNQHHPIIEHVAFLRLLFDYQFTTQDEKQNESFVLHDINQQTNGQFNINQKYPTNVSIQNLIRNNRDKIVEIKKELKEHADFLKERSELKIIEKMNEINELKTQKIITQLEFFHDYDKNLQFKNVLHQIAQNDIIINNYLKKKNLNNQFIKQKIYY